MVPVLFATCKTFGLLELLEYEEPFMKYYHLYIYWILNIGILKIGVCWYWKRVIKCNDPGIYDNVVFLQYTYFCSTFTQPTC